MKYFRLIFVACVAAWIYPSALQAQSRAPEVVGKIPKQDGYINLRLSLNGKTQDALFDACELFLKLKPDVKGATTGARIKVDVGGSELGFASKSFNWMIGSRPITPMWTLEHKLESIVAFAGSKAVASVGFAALGTSVIELNFDRLEVLLLPSSQGAMFKNKLPILKLDDMPGLKFLVHDKEISFFIATADNDTLSLPAKLFDDLVGSKAILLGKREDSGSVGNSRMVNERIGWFLSGQLMGKNLRGVDVTREEGETGEIGIQWLRKFNCIFDLGAMSFSYEARTDPKPPVDWQSMLGAIFEYSSNSVRAWGVREDSAAGRAGLKKGDAVLQFGSIPAAQLNVESMSELIAESADKVISCEVERGSPKEIIKMNIKLGKFESLWDFGGRTTE